VELFGRTEIKRPFDDHLAGKWKKKTEKRIGCDPSTAEPAFNHGEKLKGLEGIGRKM